MASTAVLNGRTYSGDDFKIVSGRPKYADLFPEPLATDAVAEWAASDATMLSNFATQNALYTQRFNELGFGGNYSTTSLLIATGAKNFVLTAATSLNKGWYLVRSQASPSNGMIVRLAADLVSGTAFNTTCDIVLGAGTFADWFIVPLGDNWRMGRSAKTAGYTLVAGDHKSIIECTSGGPFTITGLAVATAGAGYWFVLVNNSGGNVTFNPNAAELVNGASTLVLATGRAAVIVSTGAAWFAAHTVVAQHDLISAFHTETGLTAGQWFRATGATSFAFAAAVEADLPAAVRRAGRAARVHSNT